MKTDEPVKTDLPEALLISKRRWTFIWLLPAAAAVAACVLAIASVYQRAMAAQWLP